MSYKSLLFSFQGRIGRQTYWLCALGLFAALLISGFLLEPLGEELWGIFSLVVTLAVTYMSFAVAAKRWHDRNKSGWWSLIAFIPIVGQIWMVIENGFLPGTVGPNRFGPDPIGPTPIQHQGQTYLRQRNGTFTDQTGNPVRDMALVGALGAAYVATLAAQSSVGDAYSSSALDRSDTSPTAESASDSSGSSGWSWGWSGSSDGGSDSGGDGGGGGGD